MGVVVSFEGFTPAARFDEISWETVDIEEGATSAGPWTLIDTLALDPDADPSQPASRDLTTPNGTADDLFYRLIFNDGSGGTSEPTSPIRNVPGGGPSYATTEQLASKLKINEATNHDDLQRVLIAAALEIDTEIGRSLDASATPNELALAATVNLSRAQDLWTIEGLPVGIIGLGSETPLLTPRDSWERHARNLAPLKVEWGLA